MSSTLGPTSIIASACDSGDPRTRTESSIVEEEEGSLPENFEILNSAKSIFCVSSTEFCYSV